MKYTIIDIYEEDYGCEGIPENGEIICNVILENEKGERKTVKLPDSYLLKNKLDIGDILEN